MTGATLDPQTSGRILTSSNSNVHSIRDQGILNNMLVVLPGTNMEALPRECMHNIFSRLSVADRCQVSLVCRRWFRLERTLPHDMKTEVDFWEQRLVLRRFPNLRTLRMRVKKRLVLPGDAPDPQSEDQDGKGRGKGGLGCLTRGTSGASDSATTSSTSSLTGCMEDAASESTSSSSSDSSLRRMRAPRWHHGSVMRSREGEVYARARAAGGGSYSDSRDGEEVGSGVAGVRGAENGISSSSAESAAPGDRTQRDGAGSKRQAEDQPTDNPAGLAERAQAREEERRLLTQAEVDEILDGSKFARLGAMGAPLGLQMQAGTKLENLFVCNCEAHELQKGLIEKVIYIIGQWVHNLKHVEYHGSVRMDDFLFRPFCEVLGNLESMILFRCVRLSDQGLASLSLCSKLNEVHVDSCPLISGSFLPPLLLQCQWLRRVELRRLALSAREKRARMERDGASAMGHQHLDTPLLSRASDHQQLKSRAEPTQGFVARQSGCKALPLHPLSKESPFGMRGSNLEELVLQECSVETSFFTALTGSGIRSLRRLVISSCPEFSDSDLQLIAANAPGLKELEIEGCDDVGDLGVEAAMQMSRGLERVSLSGCSPSLTSQTLLRCVLGSPALKGIKLSWCPGVREVEGPVLKAFMHRRGIALADSGQLSALGNGASSTDGAAPGFGAYLGSGFVAEHPGWPGLGLGAGVSFRPRLLSVNLTGIEGASDLLLTVLGQSSPFLEVLRLQYCSRVTEAGILALVRSCQGLEHLRLVGFSAKALGDVGMKAVGEASQALTAVSLNACVGLTREGIVRFVKVCSQLKCLQVTQCFQLCAGTWTDPDERTRINRCGKCQLCTDPAD